MMIHAFPKLLMQILLTLGLILVSSHVGECQKNKKMFPMFASVDLSLGDSPASAPAPAPAPESFAPAPAPGPAFAPGPAPGPQSSSSSTSGLQVGFYKGKCANVVVDVEAIISAKIQELFLKDPTVLPALLRLQFHDCFVHGCDASILIAGNGTERTAGPDSSVRGYDKIDTIKAAVEAECPGVVSCADILAVATAVVLKLGGGPEYSPETGRRDGLVSKAGDVNLPKPTLTGAESAAFFAERNFTTEEMVVLLGCHAVGITHCGLFESRLYPDGFGYDPLMNSTLRTELTSLCPENSFSQNFTPLNQDPTNNNTVDNSFYKQLKLNRGVLPVDQSLSRDPVTSDIVDKLALNATLFNLELGKAMIKLQAFQVLTGSDGNIRTVCSKLN